MSANFPHCFRTSDRVQKRSRWRGAVWRQRNAAQWRANGSSVFAIVIAFALLAPVIWKRIETFAPGHDYRIPYALSNDYWLYQRRLKALDAQQIPILGDSVVWGEYVRADGTLSHFLNRETGRRTFRQLRR